MSAYSRFVRRGLPLLLVLACAIDAHALDYADGKMQMHGFLSQGIVFTSDNNFLGGTENGSLDFREIGINLTFRPDPDWQISGQLLSHRAGELDEGRVRLDYGMVDWAMVSGEWGKAGVRAGRIKHSFGLYNETRDVAFTRPSVILPQSIYFEQARNLEMSSDGAAVYLERYGADSNFYVTYGVGYAQVGEKSVEAAFAGRNYHGQFKTNPTHLLNLLYEGNNGRYRVGVTSAWGRMDYDPDVGSLLGAGWVSYHPVIFSGQYNSENWSLTAEHFFEFIQYESLGPLHPDDSVVAQSYYLQGAYRVAPKWETFLRYDVFYGNKDDRDGSELHAATGLPGFMSYAKDWSTGVRYDVTPHFMVRAELHQINGTGWLSSLENPDPLGLEQHWSMFMLLGSFRF